MPSRPPPAESEAAFPPHTLAGLWGHHASFFFFANSIGEKWCRALVLISLIVGESEPLLGVPRRTVSFPLWFRWVGGWDARAGEANVLSSQNCVWAGAALPAAAFSTVSVCECVSVRESV